MHRKEESMEYKAGQWVRVVRGCEEHPSGVVRRVAGVCAGGGSTSPPSRYLPLACVELWVPRPGERVKGAVLEYVVAEDDGYRPWGGRAICVPARHEGVLSWPCLSNLSPVLNAEGFPLGALPSAAEVAPVASPPPPSLACACGAPLVESLFSRRCEKGHEGAETYARPVEEPSGVHEMRAFRGVAVDVGRDHPVARHPTAERLWRAFGAKDGRYVAVDHPTRDGAIAAWKAAR
jgi:hypothetical protein